MRRLAPVGLAFCVLAAAAPATEAKTVRGGKVFVGEGAAGIALGMTRKEVKQQLGRPHQQNPAYMAYGPEGSPEAAFDLYLENLPGDPVRMIGLWGKRFELPDGTRIFDRRGVVAHLKDLYGDRLKRKHQKRTDTRLFRLKGSYEGRRVWTDFNVDRFGKKAKILSLFILYPNWTS